ncbi:unnamed protein product [Cyclocybe aegerita]|uniref:Uncharacterized protein n=1 Tax=Cyclocybe aegerita TaxID=1973307 RepID=A0A8S0WHH6_CYCAE|nr:unnamed protein product [Cyclocybe aegerita]
MRPFANVFSTYTTACIVLAFLAAQTSAYFIINEPSANRQWTNNAANLVSWSKGVLDGIHGFDVEMARMSQDGLMLIARNVPAKQKSLNLLLLDVPPGDDYFLIFINSTHGVMHATSPRFTVLAPSSTPSSTPPTLAAGVPTVTVSGGPNPTLNFATTFPAMSWGRWEGGTCGWVLGRVCWPGWGARCGRLGWGCGSALLDRVSCRRRRRRMKRNATPDTRPHYVTLSASPPSPSSPSSPSPSTHPLIDHLSPPSSTLTSPRPPPSSLLHPHRRHRAPKNPPPSR